MSLAFYLDVVVSLLLVATIVYSGLLNRRLSALRSNKAEFEALIQSFNDACARAETGVRSLRTATDEATRLQQYLDRSQTLRDDLSYLLERGTSLADRLEGGVRTARTEAQSQPAPRTVATPAAANGPVAPRAPAAAAPEEARPARTIGMRPRGSAAAEAAAAPAEEAEEAATPSRLGERIPSRIPVDRPVRDRSMARQAMADAAPRSRAERELLQALREKR